MADPIRMGLCLVSAAAIMLAGPLMLRLAESQTRPASAPEVSIGIPPGCQEASPHRRWQPEFVGADRVISQSYACSDYAVYVHAAIYLAQKPGREAVSDANSVYPRTAGRMVRGRADSSTGFEVDQYRANREGEHLTVWSWFSVGDTPTRSPFAAKLLEAWRTIRAAPAPTIVWAVGAESEDRAHSDAVVARCTNRIWSSYLSGTGAA